MTDTLPPTSHVSVRLGLSASLAVLVFDASDPPSVAVPGATLELLGPVHRSDALRARRGRLRTGRRPTRPLDVELELTAWSSRRTELALRVVGRRRPSRAYAPAAAAVVARVAEELELRGLLALHPAHGTGAREEATSAWL